MRVDTQTYSSPAFHRLCWWTFHSFALRLVIILIIALLVFYHLVCVTFSSLAFLRFLVLLLLFLLFLILFFRLVWAILCFWFLFLGIFLCLCIFFFRRWPRSMEPRWQSWQKMTRQKMPKEGTKSKQASRWHDDKIPFCLRSPAHCLVQLNFFGHSSGEAQAQVQARVHGWFAATSRGQIPESKEIQ